MADKPMFSFEERAKALLKKDSASGVSPDALSVETLRRCGFSRSSLLSVIRGKCLACKAGNEAEVASCADFDCSLWLYRNGSKPRVWRCPDSPALMAAVARHRFWPGY